MYVLLQPPRNYKLISYQWDCRVVQPQSPVFKKVLRLWSRIDVLDEFGEGLLSGIGNKSSDFSNVSHDCEVVLHGLRDASHVDQFRNENDKLFNILFRLTLDSRTVDEHRLENFLDSGCISSRQIILEKISSSFILVYVKHAQKF